VNDIAQSIIVFVQEHQHWGLIVVFALAFFESFALISLFVPATAILFGVGGLIGAAQLDFWPIWSAATAGAIVSDWLAYELTLHFKERITSLPPFSAHPELLGRGIVFFRRWGLLAVFVGRFFGPLRAIVPVVAGLYTMPRIRFQIANLGSAFVWAAGILSPGFLSVRWMVS